MAVVTNGEGRHVELLCGRGWSELAMAHWFRDFLFKGVVGNWIS